jgi:hypothetical protein
VPVPRSSSSSPVRGRDPVGDDGTRVAENQEFQARSDAVTGNREWLKQEFDRRLEISEEMKQKVVGL